MKIFRGENIRVAGSPVVTVGTFDGVHLGHRMLLARVVERAEAVKERSVVVTFDPHPAVVLGFMSENRMLLTSLEEKLLLLEESGVSATVVLDFNERLRQMASCTFAEEILCRGIGMRHLVAGFNNSFGNRDNTDSEDMEECARRLGFSLERVGSLKESRGISVSSTLIREALLTGDIVGANTLLGYTYFLRGVIVEGKKIGRSIGFPTANISSEYSYKLVPADGVYLVRVSFNGEEYVGMANIGRRPTVSATGEPRSVEVHIFDFAGSIYGQTVTLKFLERMRDEMKFSSLDELKQQLERDSAAARRRLE